jgi:hypothetical protein
MASAQVLAPYTERDGVLNHDNYQCRFLNQNFQPESWPKSFSSTMAWDGTKLEESQYTYHLSKGEIEEIETALNTYKGIFSILMVVTIRGSRAEKT